MSNFDNNYKKRKKKLKNEKAFTKECICYWVYLTLVVCSKNTFTSPSFFLTFALQNTYKRVLCLVFEKLEASVSLTAFFGLVLFNFFVWL